MKYTLHVIDLQSENPWDNKAVYLLYTELITGEYDNVKKLVTCTKEPEGQGHFDIHAYTLRHFEAMYIILSYHHTSYYHTIIHHTIIPSYIIPSYHHTIILSYHHTIIHHTMYILLYSMYIVFSCNSGNQLGMLVEYLRKVDRFRKESNPPPLTAQPPSWYPWITLSNIVCFSRFHQRHPLCLFHGDNDQSSYLPTICH